MASHGAPLPPSQRRAQISLGVGATVGSFAAAFAIFPPLGYLPLQPRQLPGLEIAMPPGPTIENFGDYSVGRFTVNRPGDPLVGACDLGGGRTRHRRRGG